MKTETGRPEIKIVCDWCKGNNSCYCRCYICGRDVCFDCTDKVGMGFKYKWPYANKLWVCGECQHQQKGDKLLGMLYQMNVLFDAMTNKHDEIEKMGKNLNREIEKEMERRGLNEKL